MKIITARPGSRPDGYGIDRRVLRDMNARKDFDRTGMLSEAPQDEPARQQYFIEKCRQYTKRFFEKKGRVPTAFIQTFGCPNV